MLGIFRNEGKYNKYQRTFRRLHYVFVACAAIILTDFFLPTVLNVEHCIESDVKKPQGSLGFDLREIVTDHGVFYTKNAYEVGTEFLVQRTPFFGEAMSVIGPHGDKTVKLKTRSAYEVWQFYVAMLMISLVALFFDMDEYIMLGMGINTLIMIVGFFFAVLY